MNVQVLVSSGLAVVKSEEIPVGNPDHGGEKAVCLKNSAGVEVWGFGVSWQDAAGDAEAGFNGER